MNILFGIALGLCAGRIFINHQPEYIYVALILIILYTGFRMLDAHRKFYGIVRADARNGGTDDKPQSIKP